MTSIVKSDEIFIALNLARRAGVMLTGEYLVLSW